MNKLAARNRIEPKLIESQRLFLTLIASPYIDIAYQALSGQMPDVPP